MPLYVRALRCIAALVVLGVVAVAMQGQQASTSTGPEPPIVIEGLGKGTFPLHGPWDFHLGDDPMWADPYFDSSGWERLTADDPWGNQGHANQTGFGWYRCRLALSSAPGVEPRFSILIPQIKDAYEVYWNGVLVGRNGKFPPHPERYVSQAAQTFELGNVSQGVLAVRVWKAPLLSDDSGSAGGFVETPLIGGSAAIATAKDAQEFRWLRHHLVLFGVNLLCATIGGLSLLLWLRVPSRWVLFWTAGFALGSPARLLLNDAHLGVTYPLAMGGSQPLVAMQELSLWFLLLWLLSLHENRGIQRFTRILATMYITNAVLDGILVALSWREQYAGMIQIADAVSTTLWVILEAYPLFLLVYALRKNRHFDSANLLVAVLALLDQLILLFTNLVKQGRQYTNWAIAETIDLPLFRVGGTDISLTTVAGTLLFVAIVYAVYYSVRQEQRRSDALEREKMALQREREIIRHAAEHDCLTGLWNRRAILEQQEMNRSFRAGTPLSVAMIDIDYFKRINDSFGHIAGDLVLREISQIFLRLLRSYDSVGRYGGEEFLLILPNCGIKDALDRAEHLRVAVASACIREGETRIPVTASFGVAAYLEEEWDAETLIRVVDTALYQAKSEGRNCVVRAAMSGKG